MLKQINRLQSNKHNGKRKGFALAIASLSLYPRADLCKTCP